MMKINKLGFPIFSSDDVVDAIYEGHLNSMLEIFCEPDSDITNFNTYYKNHKLKIYPDFDISVKDLDNIFQSELLIPERYEQINVLEYILSKASSEEELDRVKFEYDKYYRKGLIHVLKCMIYLVDIMREHDIVWGVGRGSSVGSFILYLIGVHRINPLKYNLDFEEFL